MTHVQLPILDHPVEPKVFEERRALSARVVVLAVPRRLHVPVHVSATMATRVGMSVAAVAAVTVDTRHGRVGRGQAIGSVRRVQAVRRAWMGVVGRRVRRTERKAALRRGGQVFRWRKGNVVLRVGESRVADGRVRTGRSERMT
jgi:hypothetical protein